MSEERWKQDILQRNEIIIKMVLDQIQRFCPKSVDLIGIGGSFCNGDFYEKSDLDLAIVVNDDRAWKLNRCFVVGDVGFDIYTQSWEQFENMAEYNTPYVTKLFDLDCVYQKDDGVSERLKGLKEKALKHMHDREETAVKIQGFLSEMKDWMEELKCTDNLGQGYWILSRIIHHSEFILYMVNQAYVKRGTKRIPEEISRFPKMPKGFLMLYQSLPQCCSIEEIREKCLRLIKIITDWLREEEISVREISRRKQKKFFEGRKELSQDDLRGTYEEIWSNWKNKMYHAVERESACLSLMTMSACQEFYDEMYENFQIDRINLIGKYTAGNLKKNAETFDMAMEEWKKHYDRFGMKVLRFSTGQEMQENLYADESKNLSGCIRQFTLYKKM
ncbi:nucleotidyltransferase domain-containing protein [Sellimonas caecigallum]|uniref:Nucleotidyltransferase domain-containing protein n=1 Tax=Sellimonas caecigallum TaxID=2592333 RepID=A0ABS7L9N7_9FIRM|nr:nucleotidyltransferase domain-containing protein [Sellimonas caecigallum]MBY0759806.1 nucleotidyltransferase domain-containing protein [Sellimonas caecigallum]